MKILYFASEFPGQTHMFLWREYLELVSIGVDARLLATRMPPVGLQSHSWSEQARLRTNYLVPLRWRDFVAAVRELVSASPLAWRQIYFIIVKTASLRLRDRLQLMVHLLLATKVSDLVRRGGYRHIHCTTCAGTANIAMFAHLLTGVSYSLSLLGPRLETYGSNQANKWKYASFGLFQSRKLLRETREAIPDSFPRMHAFAPVGVNVEVVKRTMPYAPWTAGTVCQLYSCGRLHPVKGHEFVIQAVKRLIERGFPVQLVIAGEDIEGGAGYRKVVEAEIARWGLEEHVTLLGAVSEEKNILHCQRAHVYVMGSLDEAAGAVAAMEAMAMEVPVVMPDAGATSELISAGHDGLLVAPKDADALASRIEYLLLHPEIALEIGRNGRQTVATRFNHHLSAAAIAGFLCATSRELPYR